MTPPTEILVATDFGDAADAALVYGRMLARTFGASLHVLHVAENVFMRPVFADPLEIESGARRQLEQRLTEDERATGRARVAVDISDHPADAIVDYARNRRIGLIVMGTHGRRNVERLLMGSVAERVVRTATCPVLTIPETGRRLGAAAEGDPTPRA
jgi:nucleotide-binding universal stress UspA family protein